MQAIKTILAFVFLVFVAGTSFAMAIQEDTNTSEEKTTLGYALGMSLGLDLRDSGIEFDYAAFTHGLRSAMEGDDLLLLFSKEEAWSIVDIAFRNAHQREQEAARLAESLFLNQNSLREGLYVTESGLQYEILRHGTGESPAVTDSVIVHYEGYLVDGSVFDSSYTYNRGEPVRFEISNLIIGWTEGLQLMNTGSRYRLFIPSGLAYGASGVPSRIPPYSTLIFEVELIEIIDN